ncbi:endonuclease MutS2 [Carnobacterium sp. ISL-102]|uniref:endonuclease MutS2 n=1 Tax=Carnobacterium sp. ISL-102 TaxID=2819142 RepID=UPI001BEA04E0|nr:endonuclease MutS2 [Carnobacterium sp. ISL-102]MBT2732292.1 endonuclease MutS2 [Carnobacterium sp. ISL-102]
MNKETLNKLQFNNVQEEVQAKAIGNYSKIRIGELSPQTNLATVKVWQQETQEARLILDSNQHVPFMGLSRIDSLMAQVQKGMILAPDDLIEYADFLRSSRMIDEFFGKNQYQTPILYQYSKSLPSLLEIEEEIYQKIQHQKVSDAASSNLRKVRKQIRENEKEIQDKLTRFLKNSSNKEMIQDGIIVQKDGHYTVPIKMSYKNKVAGNMIEQSNKGTTVFVEPAAVAKLNEQLIMLKAEEVAQEYQILAELTGYLAEKETIIDFIMETITAFDIIFARAKYSREINGITPKVNKNEVIHIKKGIHPFLPKGAVPLDFTLGEGHRGLVITGANAGGKTVVLKTVGLLTLMTMFGIQIPVQEGTDIAVFDEVFVDIGDQQSMENALSTFSGHMDSIASILNKVKRHSLVLLDEIGSGTEPNEGAALAIAIMEALYAKGALVVTTTHYGEIKRFAEEHEDFIPAAMEFDRESLTPKFILHLGESGDSQALWIAKKVNMASNLIKQAQKYIDTKDYQTQKKEFSKNEIKSEMIKEKIPTFGKGDRILLTESQRKGLIYEDSGSDNVVVYIDKDVVEVPRQRIQLLTMAEELYPEGYDLDSLFTDFLTRKVRKDLDRGSKKAQKILDKEMKKRRENS